MHYSNGIISGALVSAENQRLSDFDVRRSLHYMHTRRAGSLESFSLHGPAVSLWVLGTSVRESNSLRQY